MRRSARDAKAARLLVASIEASIGGLAGDDLLDLADIFRGEGRSPLGVMATAEMARRGLSL